MNKQELIEHYEKILDYGFLSVAQEKVYTEFVKNLKQLDEPQPIKLKDVTARIKQLDISTRKVWLDEFLNKLGSDYGTLKYKAGYEQGKVEGLIEREKVTIPQYVADWIEKIKGKGEPLYYALDHTPPEEVDLWFCEDEVNRQNIFARAWLDGYTVEEEKRYIVKLKNIQRNSAYLKYDFVIGKWFFGMGQDLTSSRLYHTKKEIEKGGLEWIFSCEGVEIEEVEE